jgi:hypothetical protein
MHKPGKEFYLAYSLSRKGSEREFHYFANIWKSEVTHSCSVKTWDPNRTQWDLVKDKAERKETLGWMTVITARTALNFRDLGHQASRILRKRNPHFEAVNLTVSIRLRFISAKRALKSVYR